MCDCEEMADTRDEKITEFFHSVFRRHANTQGEVLFSQLDGILTSLGRKIPPGRIAKLRAKFDPDNTGRVDWASTQFVMTLASLNVVDVAAIEDNVFASAFKIFDMNCDGRVSLHEMRILLSLFLPAAVQQEREAVESTIYNMDTQRDGEIRFADFVKGVKDHATFKVSRYKEEIILASFVVAGFLLYQMFKEWGFVPVIGISEGTLGV